eukprot:11931060-Alexandrium_andersonii.AAC.1
MTTSSAEGKSLRYSAYQYSPASLVYADDQRANASLADVHRKVNEHMGYDQTTSAVRRGWEVLCKQKGPRSAEAADMGQAADYLVDNGSALGIRPLNVSERARAVGLGQYIRSLGLTDK